MIAIRTANLTLLSLLVAASTLFGVAPVAANPPLGYQMMCLQHPSECRGGGAAKATVTSADMATLKSVNARVNRSIRPKHDAPGTDVWTVSARTGDCEEYALAKRDALIRAGFSPSALRLAYVKTRSGEGHAVLVVHSNRGDLVLDVLTGQIRPLSQSGLRLISMQSADPLHWS